MRVKDINLPHVQVTHVNRFETYLSQIPILFLKFVAFTDSIVYMNMKAQNSFLGTIWILHNHLTGWVAETLAETIG